MAEDIVKRALGAFEEKVSLFFEAAKRVIVIGVIAGVMANVTTVPAGGFFGFLGWALMMAGAQAKLKMIEEAYPAAHASRRRQVIGRTLNLMATILGGLVLVTVLQFVIAVEAGVPPRFGGTEVDTWKSLFN